MEYQPSFILITVKDWHFPCWFHIFAIYSLKLKIWKRSWLFSCFQESGSQRLGMGWREGELPELLFCNLWEATVSQILESEGN